MAINQQPNDYATQTAVNVDDFQTSARAEPVEIPSAARRAKAKVRLSADISPELYDKLTELSEEMNVTKSDVLRRAIALVDVALQAKKAGKKFGVAEKNQPLTTEIVGV